MTAQMSKVLGIILFFCFWAILDSKGEGQQSLEEPYFREDEGLSNHKLWIKPTVQIVKSWKSGGLKWTGPWNYDAMGRQLPPGSQCWYCNVWIGTKLPATGGSIAGDAASQKCLLAGKPCDGSVPCCEPDDPTEPGDEELCNPIIKKCVKCLPSLGQICKPVFRRCCREVNDIYCLPTKEDEHKDQTEIETGICKRLTCAVEGQPCSAKKKCCATLQCESGVCGNCEGRSCGDCCDGYFCADREECVCMGVHKHCTGSTPCCPPNVCTSYAPRIYAAGKEGYDAVCVPRSECIRENMSCGYPGDNRPCCKKSNRCQSTCTNICNGHDQFYCSDYVSRDPNAACKCKEHGKCKISGDCEDNFCCFHDRGTNCKYGGRCSKSGHSVFGCLFGRNSAITVGHKEHAVGTSVKGGNFGYVECPK